MADCALTLSGGSQMRSDNFMRVSFFEFIKPHLIQQSIVERHARRFDRGESRSRECRAGE